MMIEEIKNIDSSPRQLRKFALAMAIPLAVIGGILLWCRREYYWYFFVASGLFICPGLLVPAVLMPLHKVWMTFAVIMGWFMTRVMLGVLFFVVLTPIALLLRLLGKDLLNTKFDKAASQSYWLARDNSDVQNRDYTKQY